MAPEAIPIDIRSTRDITEVRGMGGYLEVYQPVDLGEIGGQQAKIHEGSKIEVVMWDLRLSFRNVEIPMSGSFGAIQRRRVASDFEFGATLNWDISKFNEGDNAYLDGLFLGKIDYHYAIAMLFSLGERSEYARLLGTAPIPYAAYYYCDKVMVSEIYIVASSTGDDVIHAVVRGKGSSPLRSYYGDALQGAGGFQYTAREQGF